MGKGRGLRGLKGHCHRGLWDILAGKETIRQLLTGKEGALWVMYCLHYVAFRPIAFSNQSRGEAGR